MPRGGGKGAHPVWRLLHITPGEEREHRVCFTEAKIFRKKFPFVNGETKRPADLDSMPLDHKLYDVEGIRSILNFFSSIYLSENIFDERFGEKLVENEHFPL